MKFLFTPVDADRNILSQLYNAFSGMMSQTLKLPHIIILLLDCDFIKIMGGYSGTKGTIRWLLSNMLISIAERKVLLTSKANRKTEPKFLLMKPTPKPTRLDDYGGGRIQRRVYNRSGGGSGTL